MWGTKTSIFHDFWIVDPRGNLIYGFEYTEIFGTYMEHMELCLESIVFVSLEIWNFENVGKLIDRTVWIVGILYVKMWNIKIGNCEAEHQKFAMVDGNWKIWKLQMIFWKLGNLKTSKIEIFKFWNLAT